MSSILPSFCADTGSIHTLLPASDAPHIDLPLSPTDTLTVLLPNGQSIRSLGTCHFHFPHLQCPFTAHVFSDSALNTSLLSIAQLCRLGCVATFTSTDVHVTHKQSTVLHGSKLSTDFLWSVTQSVVSTSPCMANATHALRNDAAFIQFTHAALDSPAISTLTQAVRWGYLHSYPCLTSAMLATHPPLSTSARATIHAHSYRHVRHR